MFERSDEYLIKQALNGKTAAWVKLVSRYETSMYNYAFRMVGNTEDAKDLMQEIFLSLYRSLSSFRGDSKFKTWLYKIANYRCIEFYRRKKPTESLDDVPEFFDEESLECPEQQFSQDQQAKLLVIAMQRLSVNQRTVVEMKFFQHYTFEDIGTLLGISTNTVKSRLYSSLDLLKQHLEINYE